MVFPATTLTAYTLLALGPLGSVDCLCQPILLAALEGAYCHDTQLRNSK